MPRYCSILLTFTFSLLSIIQLHAQFEDDFADGDFTSNPEWTGETDKFITESEVLRLFAPAEADQAVLVTSSSSINNASWEMLVQLDFNPSGSNYADVFLVADLPDLAQEVNGYFVRIGNTNDEVALYRSDGDAVEKIIDGPDDYVNVSFVNVRISVLRDDFGNWTLLADNTGGLSFAELGTAFDNTYLSGNYTGVRCVYTATRSDKFYFDDFVVTGDAFVDEEPPQVIALNVLSVNELQLEFSEPVTQITAENISNYVLNPLIGSPSSAQQNGSNPAEITLTFDVVMQNGTEYTLAVEGVTDEAGNEMEPAILDFFYVVPEDPEPGDVLFNELMPDPNPPVNDLPDSEFIELYNPTSKYFQLEGWELINTTTVRTLPEYILPPGGYVLLCNSSDLELFEPYGDVLGIASFVTLTNGADSLTLIAPGNLVVDVVSYTDQWYNDPEKDEGGWSLELINPEAICSGAPNWTASNSPNGATPGAQNSVYDITPDITPPTLVSFSILSAQSLMLNFSEPIDESSVASAEVEVTPDIGVVSVVPESDQSLIVQFASPIDTGVVYQLSVLGITDCPGNAIAESQNSIEFLIGFIPGAYEVLINEIMADPTPEVALPPFEYLELYNPTNKLFDLSECNISSATFAPNTFIAPGSYLVLVSPGLSAEFSAELEVMEMHSMSSTFLTNSGRELLFLNQNGEQIDRVNYDLSWYADPDKTDGGWSLERVNPEEPCRAGDNWRAAVSATGGTPGEQNSVYSTQPDESSPVLQSVLVLDSLTIELIFNEVLDSISVLTAGYLFTPDLTLSAISNVAPDFQRVRLTFTENLQPNFRYEMQIIGLSDCSGNQSAQEITGAFGLPGEITSGRMIINEILFNPRTGGSDYVEIYNHSNAIISLKDWELGNLDNEQYAVITEEAYILFPGEYLAVTADKLNVVQEYPFGNPQRIFGAESIPSYNNGEGKAVLINPEGEITDRFDYTEDMHFALLQDVKGVSLERLDFNRPSEDPTSWMSAAETVNWGTPGVVNSQFQQPGQDDGEVWVDPEVFSPDNDGFNDLLNIHYRFNESGLAANVTIYDSSGRLLRNLVRNEIIGTEGTFSWDGTGETGERARVGIHVVYFEVFSSEGSVKGYKRSCVVASRF